MEMGTSMAGGVVVGYYLDSLLNTFPSFSVVFFFGGIATGTKTALFIVKKCKGLLKEEGR
jgi:hypothetical protein